MTLIIARKELQDLFRDRRFWVTTTVLLLLLCLSLVLSFQDYALANTERTVAQANSRTNWLEQSPKNPHSGAHFGNYAFRLKTPLSIFDNGLNSYTGTSIYLEPHKSDDFQFSAAENSTSLLRLGELTPAFILQHILPLLLIFLCFNGITQEREQHTLKLLTNQGASIRQIALGKSVGYWIGIWLILLPVFLCLGLIILRNSFLSESDVMARFALQLFNYGLYTAVVIIICTVVSAYSNSSLESLMKLLGIWILTCIIIPKLASNAGSLLHKTPSQYTYAGLIKNDEENGLDGHNPYDKRRAALLEATLKKYGADTITDLPINFDAIAMIESEKYTTSVYRKRMGEVRDIFSRQNNLTLFSAFINPLQAVQSTSIALSGTDYLQFTCFQDSAESYRLYFVNAMNDFMATRTKSGDWSTPFGKEAFRIVRPFSYREPSLAWVIRHESIVFTAMLFWCLMAALMILTLKPAIL